MKTRIFIRPLALGLLTATLTACGGGSDLDGRYEGSMVDLEIKGKTATAFMGDSPMAEMPIQRDGDRLKIEGENGTLIYTIKEDGSLTGMGETLRKCASGGTIKGPYVSDRDERESLHFEGGGKGRVVLSAQGQSQERAFRWTQSGSEIEVKPEGGVKGVLKLACDGTLRYAARSTTYSRVK